MQMSPEEKEDFVRTKKAEVGAIETEVSVLVAYQASADEISMSDLSEILCVEDSNLCPREFFEMRLAELDKKKRALAVTIQVLESQCAKNIQ